MLRARRDELRASLRAPLGEEDVRAIERELDEIAARIHELDPGARSLLDRVSIATPCDAKWDAMIGDDRVRRCRACDKRVYDLSALTRVEAEALLSASGELPCVRMYRRRDGTILTADCKRDRRRRIFHVAAALAAGAVMWASAAHDPPAPPNVAPRAARSVAPTAPPSVRDPSIRRDRAVLPSFRAPEAFNAWPVPFGEELGGIGALESVPPAPLTPEQRVDAWLFRDDP